ncbi:MAG: ATP-binding cassette domain-containing protein, partial [Nitrospinae bacterium]|nr:ATP-binding cassette domain-containing protein [Nitrospinota bacterium]
MSATDPVVVKLQGVSKYYQAGTARVRALAGVDLELNRGDFAAVMGPSGGGKTTLLNCIGALEVPDEGEIYLNRRPVSKMNDRELTALRRQEIGFVFQFFNLLPTLSVWENVELPLLLDHGD